MEVDHKQVGTFAHCDLKRSFSIYGLTNHFKIGLRREEHFDARTDNSVILDDADANWMEAHESNRVSAQLTLQLHVVHETEVTIGLGQKSQTNRHMELEANNSAGAEGLSRP